MQNHIILLYFNTKRVKKSTRIREKTDSVRVFHGNKQNRAEHYPVSVLYVTAASEPVNGFGKSCGGFRFQNNRTVMRPCQCEDVLLVHRTVTKRQMITAHGIGIVEVDVVQPIGIGKDQRLIRMP